MSRRTRHISFGLAVLLWGFTGSGIASPQVTWSVRLFPTNPEYLEVAVCTKGMPENTYLEAVTFSVLLRTTSGSRTGERHTYDFTDTQQRSLLSGQTYRRYVQHGVAGATEVVADSMDWNRWTFGEKADAPKTIAVARAPTKDHVRAGDSIEAAPTDRTVDRIPGAGTRPEATSSNGPPVSRVKVKVVDRGTMSRAALERLRASSSVDLSEGLAIAAKVHKAGGKVTLQRIERDPTPP